MEVNVGDKFELENLRPSVAKKSELEVCLYVFPIDKHVLYYFHLGFLPDKVKICKHNFCRRAIFRLFTGQVNNRFVKTVSYVTHF